MKKRNVAALIAAAVMTMSVLLTGCGGKSDASVDNNAAGSQETSGEEAPTQATLILYGEASARMSDFAENEFHDKVMEAINVDVKVQYLPWSEYAGGKTELMLSSGEKFVTYTDTAFLSKCVSKGYYADITDAAEMYAGDLKKNCGGEEAFDIWKVNGKLYALPFGNKPNAGENYVITTRQDLLEEVGMTEIKTLEDVEKFYTLAKEKHPDIIGFGRGGILPQMVNGAIASDKNVFRLNNFVSTDGNKTDDPTVFNYYASEEYKQACRIFREWYQKGMIPSYVMSNGSQIDAEFMSGKALFAAGASYRVFEYEDAVRKADPNAKFKNYYLGDPSKKPLMSRGTYSTAFAVSANVEGRELEGYVKLINLLQSSQEWCDLILYGVEGKDYTIGDDGQLEMINTDTLFETWLPDNINFKRYQSYITDDQIKTYENWNDGCIPQKDLGFSFDMTPVQTEYAQMQAVEQEYFNPITNGLVEYDEAIDEALKKLEEAGIDRFLEEYQKQFHTFYENKVE
nr:extracellular solute-binding protein [uncultured Eisenbergiella sp.]